MQLRRTHSSSSRPMRCGVTLAAVLTSALAAAAAPAPGAGSQATSSVDQGLFQALQWRGIGPYRGGRALAVTGVAGDPTTFYFGAVAGGVWKTTDAGGTWSPLTDQTPICSVGAIAVAASDHNVIYVGTGEAAPRGNITYGDGVYKSIDGGKTWTHIGLEDTRQIGALIVDPTNPDIVLVAALRPRLRPEHRARRLPHDRRRQDLEEGARTRTTRPARSTSRSIRTIPKIVYAALWQARAAAVEFLERRSGQRPLSLQRRRRDLEAADRATDCPAEFSAASTSRSPARTRSASTRMIEAQGRRPVPLRRRRRALAARQRRRPPPPARLVLLDTSSPTRSAPTRSMR